MDDSTRQSRPAERGLKDSVSAEEWNTRVELAACYRLFGRAGLDDLVFTHLSARVPNNPGRFLFISHGLLFEEVTASSLLTVDIEGNNVGAVPGKVNPAGWIVHRTVFEGFPDTTSAMHLHTTAGIAVSVQKHGLLPVNQFGLTYYGKIGYYDYAGPGLPPEEQKAFIRDLEGKRMMFLRNHGTLTYGSSIAQTYFLMHYLEWSCRIQIAAQSAADDLVFPPADVIERTVKTAQGVGDSAFAEAAFRALLRKLDREAPSYRE